MQYAFLTSCVLCRMRKKMNHQTFFPLTLGEVIHLKHSCQPYCGDPWWALLEPPCCGVVCQSMIIIWVLLDAIQTMDDFMFGLNITILMTDSGKFCSTYITGALYQLLCRMYFHFYSTAAFRQEWDLKYISIICGDSFRGSLS